MHAVLYTCKHVSSSVGRAWSLNYYGHGMKGFAGLEINASDNAIPIPRKMWLIVVREKSSAKADYTRRSKLIHIHTNSGYHQLR